jgi:hypothetical protein
MEENYYELRGQIVIVDSLILPLWGQSPHQFIYQHYSTLESRLVRRNLYQWLELVFGYKQQKHEFFNMFKPLTHEVPSCQLYLRRM